MKTNRIQELIVALLFITLTQTAMFAQTPVWGSVMGTSGYGYSYGTFQSGAFTNIEIGDTLSTTNWTAVSVKMTDPTGTTSIAGGNTFWTYVNPTPFDTLRPYGDASSSPGAVTGLAAFESMYLDYGNFDTTGGFGLGTAPSGQAYIQTNGGAPPQGFHRGELISPPIDLTAYQDSIIKVVFWTKYEGLNPIEYSVSLSLDDGLIWSTVKDITEKAASTSNWSGNGAVISFVFRDLIDLPLATNLNNCRIRFAFEGSYYTYAIDEVSIYAEKAIDLAIAEPDTNSNSILAQGSVAQISGKYYTPINQLDLSQFVWSARVESKLGDTLTDLPLYLHQPIGYDSLLIDTLFGNGLVQTTPSKLLTDLYPYNCIGTYDLDYEIALLPNDAKLSNNLKTNRFVVSNNYWSYCRHMSHGAPAYQQPFLPNGGTSTINNFETGSVFYVANSDQLDSVSLSYYIPNNYVGLGTQPVQVKVYQWNDLNNDNRIPDTSSYLNAELQLVGEGAAVLPLSAGLGFQDTIVSIAQITNNMPLMLSTGNRYLVTIAQGTAHGGTAFTGNTGFWFGVDDVNYSLNMYSSPNGAFDGTYWPNHTWPSVTFIDELGGTNNGWSTEGLGGRMQVSMGLHLDEFIFVDVQEVQKNEIGKLEVFPNPSHKQINIHTELDENTRGATYQVIDRTGRIIFAGTIGQNELKTLTLAHVPAGNYFVIVQTPKGRLVKPFIKQ